MYSKEKSEKIIQNVLSLYGTKRWNSDVFVKNIYELEKKYNKYLYDFNVEELISLFNLEVYESRMGDDRVFVSNYLDFCFIKEYTNINLIKDQNITLGVLLENNTNINSNKVVYISKNTYKEYISKIEKSPNATYFKALFMAVYEGILGTNYEDLAFLSIKDLDRKNNLVKLRSDKTIGISEELMKLLVSTYSIEELIRKERLLKLKDTLGNDAIFKSATRTDDYEKSLHGAKRKFYVYITDNLAEIVGNDDLTAYMIYASGLVNYVLDNLEKNNQNFKTNNIVIQKYLDEFGCELTVDYFKKKYSKYIKMYYKEAASLSK